jgi:hypothetical protein
MAAVGGDWLGCLGGGGVTRFDGRVLRRRRSAVHQGVYFAIAARLRAAISAWRRPQFKMRR